MLKAKRSYVASYRLLFKPLSFSKLFLQASARNVSKNLLACICCTVHYYELFLLRFKELSEKVAKPKTPASLL
jgi:hypothetical protein